ncbi:FAD-binding protein [Subtercola frigoramans]|uniref:Xylitol oxidase n=1 Tax=Subtercola frigoramans TaxID=120298 RepID=A0ABS2L3L4_9MICO|nr:FAD-binding protein [Subtercola frigoramans]MBM7471690.1 xylitol oxidase [Subtercola frigoramans]
MSEKNWAGNVTYRAGKLRRPRSLDELQEVVGRATTLSALGSRHSFNRIADTAGELVSLDRLERPIDIDSETMTVRVGGGVKYGVVGQYLQQQGYALANLASLPHISVAGAIATATHGSGDLNQNLSAGVRSMQLVQADGSLVEVAPGDEDFDGYAVALGALGVVTEVSLAIVPTFDVATSVFERLPWPVLLENFDDVTRSAYSVSLFTRWSADTVDQAWLKSRVGRRADINTVAQTTETFFGATPARTRLHPLPGVSAAACTEQQGIPGPWVDRLPHFRLDFTPSNGDELQSEFLVERRHAVEAFEALRALGDRIDPVLQISEIRTVAADTFWLSSAGDRESVALHFTWKPLQTEVEDLLVDLERALAPFDARPHWGKVFTAQANSIAPLYAHLPDFVSLADRVDPNQKFRTDFLRERVFGF